MQVFRDISQLLQATWAEWGELRLERLIFAEGTIARQVLLALIGVAAIFVVIRSFGGRNPGHRRMALPAIVTSPGWSRASLSRHGALLLALAGLPFFILALADPRTSLTRSETRYPGRRISLLIDASSSMLSALPSTTLAKGAPNNAAFFTTVGAARYFIERRMAGKYRDLMALVEFGDDAYVITPFTTDYENILLSTALIGDWNEFMAFPDQGTVVARAVEQSVGLFNAFKYLDASGNLMVIFTDGEDTTSIVHGRSLDDILKSAVDHKIPLFFVRTNYDKEFGEGIPDAKWKAAVEKTGGRYYVAKNEATLIAAVEDIDREAAGTIATRQYSSQQARFSLFALAAAALWTSAAGLKLATPWFGKLP